MSSARRSRRRKSIHQNSLRGQEGINIIEAAVIRMGFVWSQMGGVEAGIDGTIEVRDSSGEMLHSIVRVQSKATAGPLQGDSVSTCSYLCDERDLEYWTRGNVPVVLVCSRTDTREAYWVSIKDYFRDPERRRTRKVIFDKERDRFDEKAAERLRRLAIPAGSGTYLAPAPRRETLVSNLLRVTALPSRLFHAVIERGSREDVRKELLQRIKYPPREFVVRGKTILSIHDLSAHPWNEVADPGTVEVFPTNQWADSDDEQCRRDFVELLGHCLAEKLSAHFVRFNDRLGLYYFAATPDLRPRHLTYLSAKNRAKKEVFGPRQSKRDPTRTSYYRHSAFEGQFVRLEGTWFLEVVPTYHFTSDGSRRDRFSAARMTGIKKLEKNQSVLGQLRMWGAFLAEPPTLFGRAYPHLQFGELVTFAIDIGIDDSSWLKHEEQDLMAVDEIDSAEDLFNS